MKKSYFYFGVFFGAIGLMASDTFIPSIKDIANNFNVSVSVIQSAIAIFMLGFCLARFFISVISDALGRKAMFILCFSLLTLGSVVCLLSHNETIFIIGRFLQGVGAGGSNVLARVIIRDITDNQNLAQINSRYSMYAVTLMVSAPFIGSVLQTYYNWQASFLLLTLLSFIALLISGFSYQETNAYMDREHLKLTKIRANLGELVRGKNSIKYAGLLFANFGFMTAWLASGSLILQEKMHLSYMEFGYCALLVGFFYFMASFVSSKYVKRVGEKKLISFGTYLLLLPPIILFMGFLTQNVQFVTVIIIATVALSFFSAGLIIPNSYSLGVRSFNKIAGIAGAFFGFAQMFGGCIYGFFISRLSSYSLVPLFFATLATLIISFCCVLRVEFRQAADSRLATE